MQDIKKRLFEDFSAVERDGCIEIEFPVVMNTAGTLVSLQIEQREEDYIIIHPENIFSDRGNDTLEFYYGIFKRHVPECYYDVKLIDGVLTMHCKNDFNVAVAINDFLRFMIMFDDFIVNNNVIGREEDFT